MSAADPIEPFAPTVDATLEASFRTGSEISLHLVTDKFPNYGFRVLKNDRIIATGVDFEASCVGLRASQVRSTFSMA
jgi:hypothetical protein